MFNDVTRNRLRFIQVPSKRLKKDTRTQVNNSTFIFIAEKVFGFPVAIIKKCLKALNCCLGNQDNLE